MFTLQWVAVFLTMHGPNVVPIEERITFKTKAECEAFGEKTKPRVADWMRGRLGMDWDFEVGVGYTCQADGDPA